MIAHIAIPIGTTVYVVNVNQVIELTVKNHEWWKRVNTLHPVYYDLIDSMGNSVFAPGTGNWHFQDVFLTSDEAINELKIRQKNR